ncbi:MAG: DMT family transporter [Lachnospiraceae bacterium]|nr:DMT family transporter [Lachnospiraceae bacterium]
MRRKKQTSIQGVLLLLLTALIWGCSFVSQSLGMEHVGAFTFNGIRTVMGALVLTPIIIVGRRGLSRAKRDWTDYEHSVHMDGIIEEIKYGLVLGVVFFIASNLQQFAFYYSTAGKIAFITAFYIFFVALFGMLIGKKVSRLKWLSVAFALVGLFYLCITPGDMLNINKGDILALLCALAYAVHILLIERFVEEADSITLSCVQFFVAGIMSCICMFIFEQPSMDAILSAAGPLLYAGILSCGIAYTTQMIGQKYAEATVASILMSMESVFAVIAAAIILHETLIGREIVGCAVMFASIILSQVADKIAENYGW